MWLRRLPRGVLGRAERGGLAGKAGLGQGWAGLGARPPPASVINELFTLARRRAHHTDGRHTAKSSSRLTLMPAPIPACKVNSAALRST